MDAADIEEKDEFYQFQKLSLLPNIYNMHI